MNVKNSSTLPAISAVNQRKPGVLLLAHGTADSLDDIPEFLHNVTGGRPVPHAVVDEVRHRYSLIGHSPMNEITARQGELLAREIQLPVYVGMRNWRPLIAETVQRMHTDGITHAVAICLAPQNSRTSVGLYRKAVEGETGLPFVLEFVEEWHDHPQLIAAFAEKLTEGWLAANRDFERQLPVLFTAHSVPERTIVEGDPYERQTRETAAMVAKRAGLSPEGWHFAFQSQGMSGGAWIGPTVEDTLLSLQAKGHNKVFLQPIGFLCDHVEVLYDIDIGFQQFAKQHGMQLRRAESLNESSLLISALAEVARTRLARLERRA